MRKIQLLLIAAVLGFFVAEIIVNRVVGYPRYVAGSRKFSIHSSLGPYDIVTLRPPYYSFWNVEGGNNAVRLNNVGLSGVDIDISAESEYLFLLGNSFVEAHQYPGELIAAGYLQNRLKSTSSKLKVINLGSSGHDPYTLWYRLLFFRDLYPPSKVILVCESFERIRNYFSRWSYPLSIESHLKTNIEIKPSDGSVLQRKFRSSSAYVSLVANLMKSEEKPSLDPRQEGGNTQLSDEQTLDYLKQMLCMYRDLFKDDFLFVSIMIDNPLIDELISFCRGCEINYSLNQSIMKPDFLIGGDGHLNQDGNKLLGDHLYSSICDVW